MGVEERGHAMQVVTVMALATPSGGRDTAYTASGDRGDRLLAFMLVVLPSSAPEGQVKGVALWGTSHVEEEDGEAEEEEGVQPRPSGLSYPGPKKDARTDSWFAVAGTPEPAAAEKLMLTARASATFSSSRRVPQAGEPSYRKAVPGVMGASDCVLVMGEASTRRD